MDPTTELLMMGAAGPSGPPNPGTISDPGNFMIVPWSSSIGNSPNQFKYVNLTTNAVAYTITRSITSPSYPMRFGALLVEIDIGGNYTVRGITNNYLYSSGNISSVLGYAPVYNFDVIKISSTRFAMMFYKIAGGVTLRLADFSVNTTTGALTLQTDGGVYSVVDSGGSAYSCPRMGGQATFDSNAILSAPITTVGFQSYYSYSGSTQTLYGIATITGGTVSTPYSTINSDNFSRPYCATGDNGYCQISDIDGGNYNIFSGTSGLGSWFSSSAPYDTSTPATAIRGTSGAFMAFGIDYFNAPTSYYKAKKCSGPGSAFTPSLTFGTTKIHNVLQTTKAGCALAYADSAYSSNELQIYKYTNSTDTWSGHIITEGGSNITGTVNLNNVCKKPTNY